MLKLETFKTMNVSDVAAYSLQSGMSLAKTIRFSSMVGRPMTEVEEREVAKVRRYLRQANRALGF